jgi:hypothetical protein
MQGGDYVIRHTLSYAFVHINVFHNWKKVETSEAWNSLNKGKAFLVHAIKVWGE